MWRLLNKCEMLVYIKVLKYTQGTFWTLWISIYIDVRIRELYTSAMSTISLLWSRSCSSCCSLMLTSVLKSSIRFMMVSAVSRVMVLLYRYYSLSIEVLLRNWADHDISWLNKCKIVTTATANQQQRQKPMFNVTFRHWAGRQRSWVTRDRGCLDHEIIGARVNSIY